MGAGGREERSKKEKKKNAETCKTAASHASPIVRAWLEKYGDDQIADIKICRKPIFSMIEKLANLLSSGKWEENKQSLSYDKMMHLFALFRVWHRDMDNVKCFKIEKNYIVEIKPLRCIVGGFSLRPMLRLKQWR